MSEHHIRECSNKALWVATYQSKGEDGVIVAQEFRCGIHNETFWLAVPTDAQATIQRLSQQIDGHIRSHHEVEQVLGKALGYPWYKDDQKNFPDATEADGVCVGDHVPESLADEAADKIQRLEQERDELRRSNDYWLEASGDTLANLERAVGHAEVAEAENKRLTMERASFSSALERAVEDWGIDHEKLQAENTRLRGELDLAARSIHVGENHRGAFEVCTMGLCPQRRAALDAGKGEA